jgi:ATP-binding cassette subfamily F protein 3
MQQLEDGKRYKRSYHGYREEIVIDHGFSRVLPVTLPTPYPVPGFSPPSTMTSSILQLSEVSYRYPGTRKDVIDNVSLDISPTARIGFLGPNGCGKSTLMDLLAGVKKPTKGEVKGHHRLRIGYFSQHTVDSLNLALTPLEQLREFYPPSKGGSADPEDYQAVISEAQARAHFATVGVTGNIITKQTIKTLSGGQRNRVALGCVTYTQPHLLLLDEITNHLDMGSVESIVESLRGFEGAVVVVSHDVWFLRQVVMGDDGDDGDDDDDGSDGGEKGEGGVLYIVNGKFGGLRRWEQGLDEYVERVRKRAWKAAVAATGG